MKTGDSIIVMLIDEAWDRQGLSWRIKRDLTMPQLHLGNPNLGKQRLLKVLPDILGQNTLHQCAAGNFLAVCKDIPAVRDVALEHSSCLDH